MLITIHPALVHFPITLLLVALGLVLAHRRRPDPFLDRAAYGALVLGWFGAAAAVASGLLAAAIQWPYDSATLSWINGHAVASFALLYVSGQAVLLRKRDPAILSGPRSSTYLGWLMATAILVVLTGWIGGHLVYGLDVVKP